jgi:hypothetical protein
MMSSVGRLRADESTLAERVAVRHGLAFLLRENDATQTFVCDIGVTRFGAEGERAQAQWPGTLAILSRALCGYGSDASVIRRSSRRSGLGVA